MDGDPDADGIRCDDRDDDRASRIDEDPNADHQELHGGRREHRPKGSVDAPRGEHAGVEHADRHAQRKLDDDEERVEAPNRIVVGRKPESQQDTNGDRQSRAQDHRQDQPAADFAFDAIPVTGLEQRPEPLAHDLEKPPPGAADDEAADPQDHHGKRRQSAETGEEDQEFRDVDDESRRIQHQGEAQAVAEVLEDPASEKARIQRDGAVFATGSLLEPAVDLVHRTRSLLNSRLRRRVRTTIGDDTPVTFPARLFDVDAWLMGSCTSLCVKANADCLLLSPA